MRLPPPPRRVSTVLAGQLLFGGETALAGWLPLIAGSGVFWLALPKRDILIVVPIAFAIAGLTVVAILMRRGYLALHALRVGKTTTATVVSETRTGTKIGSRRVHELRYSFAGEDGTMHEMCARTAWPDRISAKNQEIVYDPAHPSNAVLIKLLPPLIVDQDGNITANPSPAIVGPLLVIAVNAIGFWSAFH